MQPSLVQYAVSCDVAMKGARLCQDRSVSVKLGVAKLRRVQQSYVGCDVAKYCRVRVIAKLGATQLCVG
jgi:hypothetical protein